MSSQERVYYKIRGVLQSSSARKANAGLVAEVIRNPGKYRSVGIYEVKGKEAAAVVWSGAGCPSHLRFSDSQGLCGVAVLARLWE